jgi:hypothetical protein
MSYTSVNRDDLLRAFALAHKCAQMPEHSNEVQRRFRAIEALIWRAHGEQGRPPTELPEWLKAVTTEAHKYA